MMGVVLTGTRLEWLSSTVVGLGAVWQAFNKITIVKNEIILFIITYL